MSKLQENMRRFRTKNLQEQALYKTMADMYKALKSGQVDAAGMAEILKRADMPAVSVDMSGITFGNDSEAAIQSVFAAIKDINTLNKIFQILKRSVEDYVDDVGDELYDMNYHGGTNVPTVRQSLQRLGYQIKQ
jgi:hypothetical protein